MKLFRFLNKSYRKESISIFHEFHKPPYGGGNQFLLALKSEFESRGYAVMNNDVNSGTIACLFNSFNFDFEKLRSIKKSYPSLKMIHRVDGPIDLYRGSNEGTDLKIANINNEIADKTIFQSNFSYQKHIEMNLNFIDPVVIYNAVDGNIFNSKGRISPPDSTRKIKLIAVSWSDNLNKGGPVYKWIEDHLDFEKYEFTFVGRTRMEFSKIKVLDAVPSEELAKILRQNDIYITASQNDPCSNSLIEALSCGLPAIYLNSGGHPELVKNAGLPFNTNEEALNVLDEVAENYEKYQSLINVKSMKEISDEYLKVILKHE